MQVISIIAILFAMINVILIIMYITREIQPCTKQEIIDNIGIKSVKIIPELDIQFSESNLPSKVYTDIFQNENIWISGYSY